MNADIRDLAEIAALFHVTEKAVRGWVAAGMPTRERGSQGGAHKKTRICVHEAVEWYFHENYERLELDRARTRLADEQSGKIALENALRRGELGELSTWQRELEKFLSEFRAAFLSFPVKLAPLLDGDVNRRKVTLESAVYELLESLAAYGSDYSPDKRVSSAHRSVSDDSASTPEAHGEPVGGPAPSPLKRKQRRARPVEN